MVCLVFAALAFAVDRAPTPVIMALTALVGMGLGMVMPPRRSRVQTAAGRSALGVATASISLCRAVGGATGVALVGAALFALVTARARARRRCCIRRSRAAAGPSQACRPPQRASLVEHVNDAYRVAFGVLAAIAAIGALIATTVPRFDWREGEVEPTEG